MGQLVRHQVGGGGGTQGGAQISEQAGQGHPAGQSPHKLGSRDGLAQGAHEGTAQGGVGVERGERGGGGGGHRGGHPAAGALVILSQSVQSGG